MAFSPNRVVEVFVDGDEPSYGSGYLLSDRLVLTAAHVVASACTSASVSVREYDARVANPWIGAIDTACSTAGDVALVALEHVVASSAASCLTPRLGRVVRGSRVMCQTMGFPGVQQYEYSEDASLIRDTEHVIGEIAPLTTGRADLLTIHVRGSTPVQRGALDAPWSGLSGAAVFAGPYLVGVVVSEPLRFGATRLEVAPIGCLVEDAQLRRVLRSHPALLQPVDVHSRLTCDLGDGLLVQLRPPYEELPPDSDLARQPSAALRANYGLVPFSARESQTSGSS